MVDEPVAHLVIDDRRRGVRAHAAGVGPRVAIADALVVLRCDQRNHALAIAEDEKGKLVAGQALFQYDQRASRAHHLAAQHLDSDRSSLLFRLGDDYAFARRQAIRLNDNRRVEMR